jgi:DNA-binding transcriptional LysR family regulator
MTRRADLADLDALLAIACAGGFRRGAALRGVSGSALSHAMRGLEQRLGVRLFHRNSRSVSLGFDPQGCPPSILGGDPG